MYPQLSHLWLSRAHHPFPAQLLLDVLCDGVSPCVVATGFWQHLFETGLIIFVCSKCGGMFHSVGRKPWWKSLGVFGSHNYCLLEVYYTKRSGEALSLHSQELLVLVNPFCIHSCSMFLSAYGRVLPPQSQQVTNA